MDSTNCGFPRRLVFIVVLMEAVALPSPALANMGYWGPGMLVGSTGSRDTTIFLVVYVTLAMAVSAVSLIALRALARRSRRASGIGEQGD